MDELIEAELLINISNKHIHSQKVYFKGESKKLKKEKKIK